MVVFFFFFLYIFFIFLHSETEVDGNMWVDGAITRWGFDKLIYSESNPETAGTDGLGKKKKNPIISAWIA